MVIMFYIVSYLKIKYQSRAHNLTTLTSKSCFYDNGNSITRMLFKGTY